MQIAFIADTHRSEKAIAAAAKHITDNNTDILIHLGDYAGDAKALSKYYSGTIYAVAGNCDFTFDYPKEDIITVNGNKIYYTHGDLYNVKSNLYSLALKGESEEADIVLFGHTHMALREDYKNMIILNPGSISKPSPMGKEGAVGFITIEDDGTISDVHFEFISLR